MTHDPFATLSKRQTGRKSANKAMMRVGPLAAPPNFSEAEKQAWHAIVDDPNFMLTSRNLQIAAVAVAALTVVIHAADEIRSLTRAKKIPPRVLYEMESRAVKDYCRALRGMGVLPP
jgi:hypothetical protein